MDLIDRQPEERTEKRTETHACDLVSRQAAIDAIADYLRRVCLTFSDYMTDDESKECATCILQLVPSAQPELIRCKDCKRHNIGIGDFREDGNTRHWFWKDEACPLIQYRGKAQGHEFDYQFCAYAERRTDETD